MPGGPITLFLLLAGLAVGLFLALAILCARLESEDEDEHGRYPGTGS